MISRRRFLAGSIKGVAVTLGLPIFDCLLNSNGTAFAQGAPLPVRFGTFFWGLGCPSINTANDHFKPQGQGAGTAWSIPTSQFAIPSSGATSAHALDSIRNHKDYLTVFSNYSYYAAGSAAHIPSRGLALSASHNPTYVQDSGASGFREQSMPLASIDSVIQNGWGINSSTSSNAYINATLGVGNLYSTYSSWNNGGSFRSFYNSPLNLFNSVFKPLMGSTTTTTLAGQPSLSLVTNNFRKSILDTTLSDLQSLGNTLNAADKLRLEAHTEGIRSMETQIAALIKMEQSTTTTTMPTSGACSNIATPQNYASADQITLRNNIMAELFAYALSCNITRVFCYEFTPTQCNGTIPEIGLSSNQGVHDTYSHGDTPEMRNYVRFAMQNLNTLVDKLKSKTEGAGNLLDQMLLLATSEYGPIHYHNYHPYIFVGKAGGRLKGNYHSNYGDPNNNVASRVLLTAAHAAGVPLAKIGMPATNVINGSGQTYSYEQSTKISEVLTAG